MHTTLRDLFARENVRQAPAAGKGQASVSNLVTPEDLQQQQDQELQKSMMMPGQDKIQPSSALPMHDVNFEPDRYPVEEAQKMHAFLRNAAGGPSTGFVTSKPDAHDIAKKLAKSGHLQHHGSRPGQAGGGLVHHWSLTPKGLASIGMGGSKKPGLTQPHGAKAGGKSFAGPKGAMGGGGGAMKGM